jgi:hypothetical protein
MNRNAIATAGNTQPTIGTKIDGKYEAAIAKYEAVIESNPPKFRRVNTHRLYCESVVQLADSKKM